VIRYALVCEHDHAFEAWFGSSSDYDDQRARGLLECPICNSREVAKQIMAPAVAGTKARGGSLAVSPQTRAKMNEVMSRVRSHVEQNFDYMGDRFADEARAIHDGRSEERGIYGEATPAEVRDLVADGVPVASLPPKPKADSELN
jgi:hypothetical protein